MISKILLWFNFGYLSRREAEKAVRILIEDRLTDYKKYTEIG